MKKKGLFIIAVVAVVLAGYYVFIVMPPTAWVESNPTTDFILKAITTLLFSGMIFVFLGALSEKIYFGPSKRRR